MGVPAGGAGSESSPSPFDAVMTPGVAQSAPDQQAAGSRGVRGRSYTWLHYLILALVAFALGMVLWRVISGRDATFVPSSSGVALVTYVGLAGGVW
jgi:hypothetical protein